jgi:peptidoglycan/xylan/chitin deacetylase (PgdA/CDA1 family)
MRKIGRVFAWALALVLLLTTPSLASSGTAVGARHTTLRSHSTRLSVLLYHAIEDMEHDPVLAEFSVPPARFAEQIDGLRERGWTFVDLDTALAAMDSGPPLPEKAVLLTFDDAYADLRDEVCPLLEERGIPAVAFAVAGHVGGSNEWDSENDSEALELLCPDGLREIAGRGVEIGSHTITHPPLTELPAEQVDREVGGSAERLDAMGLPRPRAFAYPYGRWDEGVAAAVREAGYEVAFTVDRGVVEPDSDPHALPRFAVHADDTARKLHLKLTAATLPHPIRTALRRLAALGSAARSYIS